MDLESCDLLVDQIYQGSRNGNASDDPLPKLVGVDNQAGFRHLGKRPNVDTLNLIVLKTNFSDSDWPDHLDTEAGTFTYYGDNKKVAEIHDTPRQGNLILKNLFDARHSTQPLDHFPVILLFGATGIYRDVRFLGLAVPGAQYLGPDEDLVAIWRTDSKSNERFQNYKSMFTVLDLPVIPRAWINDIKNGKTASSINAPKVWLDWLASRKYNPLQAKHTVEIRSKEKQLPLTKDDEKILDLIYQRYKDDPYEFEHCAVEIARLMMPNIKECDVTQRWRDGGRDAIGKYRIGEGQAAIDVDLALEAKCYNTKNSVGVKELSRLISRLRHRQFGIIVTTSYIGHQAYKELKEDGHPVVVITASDIVALLKKRIGSLSAIERWLSRL